jgi:BirA family biotin operon repressor/biotin-[acetyl-CoA-carboxylase] ligase
MDGLYIWSEGVPGLVEPTDPVRLNDLGPGWRATVEAWGPWSPGHWPSGGAAAAVWKSAREAPGAPILLAGGSASCLDLAWHLLRAGAFPPGASALTPWQWAGRGQLGRTWISPPGNLYVAWRAPDFPGGPLLSLLAGYAVVQALDPLNLPARLKWPNDVLLDGRKVAGLLCERRDDVTLVGLGINLTSHPGAAELREGPALPAGSLQAYGVAITPLDLWLRVRERAEALLRRPPPLADVEQALAYRGEWISVREGSAPPFVGRLRGLAPGGALRVETARGERTLLSASIGPSEPLELEA